MAMLGQVQEYRAETENIFFYLECVELFFTVHEIAKDEWGFFFYERGRRSDYVRTSTWFATAQEKLQAVLNINRICFEVPKKDMSNCQLFRFTLITWYIVRTIRT